MGSISVAPFTLNYQHTALEVHPEPVFRSVVMLGDTDLEIPPKTLPSICDLPQ